MPSFIKKEKFMRYVYLALNYIFGIFFLAAGAFILFESPLGGVAYVAISLLLLPFSRDFFYSKTNRKIPVKARAITIIILFIASGIFIGLDKEKSAQESIAQQAKEIAEQAAKRKQQNIDYFSANREQIISSVKSFLVAKDYKSVISQSAKYIVSGDEELKQMYTLARVRHTEILNANKTKKLLAELKTVLSSNHVKKLSLYKQLASLHPDNKTYNNKVSFYSKKIEKAKKKQLAAQTRDINIRSQFSSWDGSHRNLERLIKKTMNDPDSYKHDETSYLDKGDYLIVITTFRGKNAFGGVVRESVKAKVSLDGQILKILN